MSERFTPDQVRAALDEACEARKAHQRVEAAAPDLLEALIEAKAAVDLLEGLTGCRGDDDYVWALQEKIDTAITKATGK